MNKFKNALLIALIVDLYLIDISLLGLGISNELLEEITGKVLGISILLSIVIIFLNIIFGFVGIRKKKTETEVLQDMKKVFFAKIILIPFFIINFIFWFAITLGFLVVPGLQIFVIITFFVIIWAYGILFATSSYAINSIYQVYKNQKISKDSFVLNTIIQLFFVFDVISYIVFYFKNRKKLNS